MARQKQDNYASTRQSIARRVLNSRLVKHVGHPGSIDPLLELEDIAQGGRQDSWSYLTVDFYKAGTNCSLSVRCESNDPSHHMGFSTDTEGNEWRDFSLTCTINYPCHGSTDPGIAMARLKLYQDVALLAAEIQAEFPECSRMTRTAAALAEEKAKEAAEKKQRIAREVVKSVRKGLRAGGRSVTVERDRLELLATGVYDVQFDEPTGNILPGGISEMKQYKLTVLAHGGGYAARVA